MTDYFIFFINEKVLHTSNFVIVFDIVKNAETNFSV